MSLPLFCYGTLMVPEIMQRVTGRSIAPGQNASLHNYGCYKVRSETFPGVRPTEDEVTQGLLYPNLTTQDIAQLDRYEGYLYQRKQVTVKADGEHLQAWCYLIKPEFFSELMPEHWCYQHFLDVHLSSFTRC